MASICKHNDREAAESRNNSRPLNDTNRTAISHRVPLRKMINDQNHKVSNGDQSNNAGIFQRIETAKERKWDNDEPVRD